MANRNSRAPALQLKPRVLVIDDDEAIRFTLSLALQDTYQIYVAPDGFSGLKLAKELLPDAIVLDLLMPDLDGAEVCKALQAAEETRNIPVILLSGAAHNPPDRIRAFNAGVDDCVAKPFTFEELQARIDSKLRKRGAAVLCDDEAPLVCGNLVLDSAKFLILINKQEVKVSVLEFQLIRYFVANVGRLLSREQIISSVWKERAILPRALDWHILTLRRKLDGFDHAISTVYGAGYILKADPASA